MDNGPDPSRARAAELISQQETLVQVREQIGMIRRRIAELELRFGIASEDVPVAIGRGVMEETLEVCDWMIDFDFLCRVDARTTPD